MFFAFETISEARISILKFVVTGILILYEQPNTTSKSTLHQVSTIQYPSYCYIYNFYHISTLWTKKFVLQIISNQTTMKQDNTLVL
jgi:hypothetical protein